MEVPLSKHFRFEQLAEGVYAAIHVDGGWGVCNAGVVDLGERTLVFDSGLTPEAGRALCAAAKALTKKVPSYLVISHYHNDHIRGSQVFTEAVELATDRTREMIATAGQAELKEDRKNAEHERALAESFAKGKDKEKRKLAALVLPYWQGMLASFPEIRLRLPDLAFSDQLTLYGSKRTAQLISVGCGHTEDDCVLFLPQDRVLFCGDLLFVKCHPFLAHGDPENLLSILDRLAKLKASAFVPGHGPLGHRRDLERMQLYIRTLTELTRSIVERGGIEEDVAKQPVPEAFADWILAQLGYQSNMRFLYRRLAQ